MKDEIKEILKKIKSVSDFDDYVDFIGTEFKSLLDYITNLQESEAYYYGQYKDYKQRNEKAIEYINENKHLSMFADCREPEEDWNYDLEINPRELLNILKGDKDE